MRYLLREGRCWRFMSRQLERTFWKNHSRTRPISSSFRALYALQRLKWSKDSDADFFEEFAKSLWSHGRTYLLLWTQNATRLPSFSQVYVFRETQMLCWFRGKSAIYWIKDLISGSSTADPVRPPTQERTEKLGAQNKDSETAPGSGTPCSDSVCRQKRTLWSRGLSPAGSKDNSYNWFEKPDRYSHWVAWERGCTCAVWSTQGLRIWERCRGHSLKPSPPHTHSSDRRMPCNWARETAELPLPGTSQYHLDDWGPNPTLDMCVCVRNPGC